MKTSLLMSMNFKNGMDLKDDKSFKDKDQTFKVKTRFFKTQRKQYF